MIDLCPKTLLQQQMEDCFAFSAVDLKGILLSKMPNEFYEEGQEVSIGDLPSAPLKKYICQTSTFHPHKNEWLELSIDLVVAIQAGLFGMAHEIVNDFVKAEGKETLVVSYPMKCEDGQVLVEKNGVWVRFTLKQDKWDCKVIIETLVALIPYPWTPALTLKVLADKGGGRLVVEEVE